MNATNPLITIGLPTYNRSIFLSKAIESVLHQTYSNIELIISDNNSTDGTKEFLSKLNNKEIKIIEQNENKGMVANWNSCLMNASGEYFLLLSDDDYLEKYAVEKMVEGFSNPAIKLVYGNISMIDKKGDVLRTQNHKVPELESGEKFVLGILSCKRNVYPSAVLFKTIDAVKLGGYPPIGTATDFALQSLIALSGSVAFIPTALVRYRVHSEAESYSKRAAQSHIQLAKWLNNNTNLSIYKKEINRYSTKQLFYSLRHEALHKRRYKALYVLKMLIDLSNKHQWKYIYLFFSSHGIQWLASLKRNTLKIFYRSRSKQS
jgi:glycosyltransferase involved in cell wall biosynthesis